MVRLSSQLSAERACKMDSINEFEHSLLMRLATHYPSVEQHIPYIRITSRTATGVGMYVDMSYVKTGGPIPDLGIVDGAISTNERIAIPGLEYGLGYEVDITDGRLTFIEIYTYGEGWDGNLEGYRFIDEEGGSVPKGNVPNC